MGSYTPGQWKAVCDVCGFTFLSGKMMTRWDGAKVDAACFEPRHPQDFLRALKDGAPPPWARPSAFVVYGLGAGDSGAIGGAAIGSTGGL